MLPLACIALRALLIIPVRLQVLIAPDPSVRHFVSRAVPLTHGGDCGREGFSLVLDGCVRRADSSRYCGITSGDRRALRQHARCGGEEGQRTALRDADPQAARLVRRLNLHLPVVHARREPRRPQHLRPPLLGGEGTHARRNVSERRQCSTTAATAAEGALRRRGGSECGVCVRRRRAGLRTTARSGAASAALEHPHIRRFRSLVPLRLPLEKRAHGGRAGQPRDGRERVRSR